MRRACCSSTAVLLYLVSLQLPATANNNSWAKWILLRLLQLLLLDMVAFDTALKARVVFEMGSLAVSPVPS
jgi:hypothetical protein